MNATAVIDSRSRRMLQAIISFRESCPRFKLLVGVSMPAWSMHRVTWGSRANDVVGIVTVSRGTAFHHRRQVAR